jgi:hypothetical protein
MWRVGQAVSITPMTSHALWQKREEVMWPQSRD